MNYAKAARGEANAKKSEYNQDPTQRKKVIANTFEGFSKRAELKVKELTRRIIEQQAKQIYPTTSPLYQGKEYKFKKGNIFNLQSETERRKSDKAERIRREKEAAAAAAAAAFAAAQHKAEENKTAAAAAAAENARRRSANADAAAEAARIASEKVAQNISKLILNGLKNRLGPGPAPRNKFPANNSMATSNGKKKTASAGGGGQSQVATGGSLSGITISPRFTGGGGNSAALITALAQFTKTAPPSMNASLLQHIKNALRNKNRGGSNLTASNKKELMDQYVALLEEREQLKSMTNNASKSRLAIVEIRIKTTRQLMRAFGITIANNNKPPPNIPKNKNNINQTLSITNRFTRLEKLYSLFRQTSKTETVRRSRLIREIRTVIRKLYGSNVSTSNALRNITNADRLVGKGRVSSNVNRNLVNALRMLKNEVKAGGKRSGLRPSGSSGGYNMGRGAGGYNMGRGAGGYNMGRMGAGGAAPPVSITISNIGKVSNSGKVSNVGKVSNAGKVANSGTTSNAGRLAVSAPTTNGNRQLAATSEQLIRGAGGAEAVEQGINALRAANGNVARAKATSRLPNNTFTNIYAMGGPVAAKRLVEQRRRRLRAVGGRRVASKKKRVARKPKKYIKLTPYQFKRLTDHIKKNNLRKVLIKEITH